MNPRHSQQSGSAMIIALIFLLLMTLIGTTAMRGSTMQERMSGNSRDWNLAFQSAEAGLREAENFLLTTPVLPDFDGTAGLYQMNSPIAPVWVGPGQNDGNGFVTYAGPLPGITAPPRYYIEELSSITPAGTETETGTPLEEIFYFRITVMGFGAALDDFGNPVASVLLSTVYRSR